MRKTLAMLFLAATLCGTAIAADPVTGSWKLDVAKSKFNPGPAPTSATRVYSESSDGVTLVGTTVTADGRQATLHVTYKADGKTYPVTDNPDADSITATSVNDRTWNFTLKKAGKITYTVHRVVSPDGKTLSVHNKGTHAGGAPFDDTLIFERQ
jgi:hypothetical protein